MGKINQTKLEKIRNKIHKKTHSRNLDTPKSSDNKPLPADIIGEYNFVSDESFQITKQDIVISKRCDDQQLPERIKTANWFVPPITHIAYGGIYTIFRFMEKLSIEGVENRIIIYYGPADIRTPMNKKELHSQIKENFAKLKDYKIIVWGEDIHKVDQLPPSDISICTLWTTAYPLLRFNNTKRKYYFIQDYEPLFYPAGPISALAESTYRFGFRGVVNTPGLLKAVKYRHGLRGVSFTPAVDQGKYRFSYEADPKRPIRIFFYARPNKPRNAFLLGIATIEKLINRYGDKVEIVAAGAEWNEGDYGLSGKITNLGLLKTLEEVSDVYKTCDIGFVFMFTKHPSYQPFEFMASGIATVTNNNEDNAWLLKDRVNCLVSEPSPHAMSESIGELIDNPRLRKKIVENGYKQIQANNWENQLSKIWSWINND